MSCKNQKVIFVSSGLSLPRVIKRVKSFLKNGYEVEIYGFDRGLFQDMNKYPPQVLVHHLGGLSDGTGYLNNLKEHYHHFLPVFKKYKNEDVLYYAVGFIPAFLVMLFGKKPFLYEISDLIYGTFGHDILKKFFCSIDRRIIRSSLLTVMTSQGFSEFLFQKKQPANVIIQPNMLTSEFNSVERALPVVNLNLRFGFIGYIRYPNTIFRFASIIGERFPDYSFSFYGDSKYRDGAIALAEKYPNVIYNGKFRNPDDLISIYNSVDVVIACYDTATFNEKIAEPNKLYEALFFSKPIVVSPDTYLAKRVEELKCGFILDATSDAAIINFLEKLSKEDIIKIAQREYEMERSLMVDNPNRLIERVEIMLNKKH